MRAAHRPVPFPYIVHPAHPAHVGTQTPPARRPPGKKPNTTPASIVPDRYASTGITYQICHFECKNQYFRNACARIACPGILIVPVHFTQVRGTYVWGIDLWRRARVHEPAKILVLHTGRGQLKTV